MMAKDFRWRFVFLCGLLIILFAILVYRMVYLTVIDRAFLVKEGNARSIRTVSISAYRGMILDRNGNPLAVSSRVYAVWASNLASQLDLEQQRLLAKQLSLPLKNLIKILQKTKNHSFVYIKRGIEPSLAQQIKALNFKGIHLQEEFKRYYPEGEVGAHILGITNIDDKGIEGLELSFDDWLAGIPGKKKVIKDRLGRIIDEIAEISPPKPGHNLYLSIDRRIQYMAYQSLQETVTKFKAESGSVVVLDVHTGEVIAMANFPSFNPNRRPKYQDARYRNRAVTDTFEPGSVMKVFSIASALDSGLYNKDTMIDTRPSWMVVNGNTIRDERNYGILSVTEVLKRSSNVGVTKMVLSSPPIQLISLLKRVGFGRSTYSGYPGESTGVITVRADDPRPFMLATLGFGYALSVTTLQLAKAYSVFANGGQIYPTSFLLQKKPPKGKQVLIPKVAKDILTMLEGVVEAGGTGRRARIKEFHVAGKTGTARIADNSGYRKNSHIATFVGIAPVSSPRLVVAVMVRDPKDISYYGGVVAAPLFAKVMSASLNFLGIRPDKIKMGGKGG